MAQPWAESFYSSKAWHDVRDFVMMRDRYCCQKCGRPAQEVHHKTHLSPSNIWDPKITLNPSNLIALCRDCHRRQHEIDDGFGCCAAGYEFDETGQLVKVTNIYGETPPG